MHKHLSGRHYNLVSAIIAEDISVLIAFIVIEVAVVPHEETVLIAFHVRRTIFPGKFEAHISTCGIVHSFVWL